MVRASAYFCFIRECFRVQARGVTSGTLLHLHNFRELQTLPHYPVMISASDFGSAATRLLDTSRVKRLNHPCILSWTSTRSVTSMLPFLNSHSVEIGDSIPILDDREGMTETVDLPLPTYSPRQGELLEVKRARLLYQSR